MMKTIVALSFAWTAFAASLLAEEATPSPDDQAHQELLAVRKGLIDAYNRQDIEGVLSFCTKDVIVTWQNGEVSEGREGVRAYYQKMMEGDHRIVESLTADPTVDGVAVIYNDDTAISRGVMNDRYRLRDGSQFALNSRWSAALVKSDGQWRIASFHASTNTFDNAVLRLAAKQSMLWAGGAGLLLGAVAGVVGGRMLRKRTQTTS